MVWCEEPQGRRQSQFSCIRFQDEDSSASVGGNMGLTISDGIVVNHEYDHVFEALFTRQVWVKTFLDVLDSMSQRYKHLSSLHRCSQVLFSAYLHEGS